MRLIVLQVLVISLLVTLVGRLWYMQVVAGEEYAQAASDNRVREVVTPAVRGAILDARGRPLVQNRTSLVVSVDRSTLLDLPSDGKRVVKRLAGLLGTTYIKLDKQLTLCGTPGAPKPPVCWNGSPYQPIPVAEDVRAGVALQVMERREEFPGVTAEMTAIRDYPKPYGVNAAHLLGYLGPVTEEELVAAESKVGGRFGTTYTQTDLVGRAGLEQVYDKYLRGKAGVKQLAVDSAGNVTGTIAESDATAGDYLVTSIDAHVQKVVEDQLLAAVKRARSTFDDVNSQRNYDASTAAAVVMEVDTGRVVASASYPSYDPEQWVGGVTKAEYRKLSSSKAHEPLINRVIQGQYAPGSTYKIVSTAAAVEAGYSMNGLYPCPAGITIGGQPFNNHETSDRGTISFLDALKYSCDTVYYQLAYNMWLKDGGLEGTANPDEYQASAARDFGFGSRTGIDLPSEAAGRVPDREWRKQYWLENKDYYCNFNKEASPEDKQSSYLRLFAKEFCVDGYQYRAGDAILASIGQSDTLATPLQIAQAYGAIANGGTIYRPQVARGVVSADGKVVKRFDPKVSSKLPFSSQLISYLQTALRTIPESGTASYQYGDFPLGKVPVAAKTGTAEIQTGSRQTTSLYASYAPADDPEYVVVMVVPEGGTGSGTSAPSVNEIYRALFGINGFAVNPANAIVPDGQPIKGLPTVKKDGTIDLPRDDGFPGQSQSGIPATTEKSNKKTKNQRRARVRRRDGP